MPANLSILDGNFLPNGKSKLVLSQDRQLKNMTKLMSINGLKKFQTKLKYEEIVAQKIALTKSFLSLMSCSSPETAR